VLLGLEARPAMSRLAAIAFPDFFRARSAELGTFIGIFESGQLVAMAGERMAWPGSQEISGVCTHPDYTGRGYAGGLTRALVRRHHELGLHSMLHVSRTNLTAHRLYESLGFAVTATLPMIRIESPGAAAPAAHPPGP